MYFKGEAMKKSVPQAVVKRLPRYYRYLESLELKGVQKVSSRDLAEMLDITASQVRQDFSCFGAFGQQGMGYNISNLKNVLASIMGLDRTYNLIVIGAGNIGKAISRYKGFKSDGFNIIALFDEYVETPEVNGIRLYKLDELSEFIKNNKVDIAVIATPQENAQTVADCVIKNGIKNIWNFATVDINVADDVIVENIFMSESLYLLSYRMREIKNN